MKTEGPPPAVSGRRASHFLFLFYMEQRYRPWHLCPAMRIRIAVCCCTNSLAFLLYAQKGGCIFALFAVGRPQRQSAAV